MQIVYTFRSSLYIGAINSMLYEIAQRLLRKRNFLDYYTKSRLILPHEPTPQNLFPISYNDGCNGWSECGVDLVAKA
jgi:hypothetical protein